MRTAAVRHEREGVCAALRCNEGLDAAPFVLIALAATTARLVTPSISALVLPLLRVSRWQVIAVLLDGHAGLHQLWSPEDGGLHPGTGTSVAHQSDHISHQPCCMAHLAPFPADQRPGALPWPLLGFAHSTSPPMRKALQSLNPLLRPEKCVSPWLQCQSPQAAKKELDTQLEAVQLLHDWLNYSPAVTARFSLWDSKESLQSHHALLDVSVFNYPLVAKLIHADFSTHAADCRRHHLLVMTRFASTEEIMRCQFGTGLGVPLLIRRHRALQWRVKWAKVQRKADENA
eukprot:CAMPEP_0115507076 /NCGR_PEP_ID=MMETSP0271-20121206/71526_1 /TAXON_ID=71861 /ORGANISM="Scrippsiella trochoidea, Strain CCMP3099" /LENGTH=287 /DNA_ID=CAMNT_0002936629 /DNA_START=500 /DNA_END=1362 /DNA_ORIENTATION=+